MQSMLTQQADLALVGGLGDTVAAGNDQLEQFHPGRAAQLASTSEEHGLAADYHAKRAYELQAGGATSPAGSAHDVASGMHHAAALSGTDADTLAARRASAYAVEEELAETQAVGSSTVTPDVATCGDSPGHPFRGNQHAEVSVAEAADKATDKARAEQTPEAHESAALSHRRAWSEAVDRDSKVALAGLSDTSLRLHADYHKIMVAHHTAEAERLRGGS